MPTHLKLLLGLAAASTSANEHLTDVQLTNVMPAGAASIDCRTPPCKYAAFRIPGLVALPPHTLLAFAEGRKFGCGDFQGQHDMIMRRSTDDGQTWGPLRTIVDALEAEFWRGISVSTHNAVWDPTPVHDAATGRTWLFFNGPGRRGSDPQATYAMHTDDGGTSWSVPLNMSASCQQPGHVAATRLNGASPTDGHGVQLSSGRLIIPMYAGSPPGAYMCYSDDHGASWHAASTVYGARSWTEMEVAEVQPATRPPTLYMTIRYDTSRPHRQYATSADGGETWSDAQPMECGPSGAVCPDPNCKVTCNFLGHRASNMHSTAPPKPSLWPIMLPLSDERSSPFCADRARWCPGQTRALFSQTLRARPRA